MIEEKGCAFAGVYTPVYDSKKKKGEKIQFAVSYYSKAVNPIQF